MSLSTIFAQPLRLISSRLPNPYRSCTSRMSSTVAHTDSLSAAKLYDFTGWTTLVTGGGTGIGLMCAQALVANGAKVYITGRRVEALEQAAKTHGKGRMIPLQADITSKESVTKLFEELGKREDKLHLLVNNAGIAGPTRTFEKAKESADVLSEELFKDTYEDWLNVYNTNVVGHYFCSVAALPLLRKATLTEPGFSSSILNISSISGLTKMTQHHAAYNASKAASIHITEMMAQEFAEGGTKVRVNGIAPGIFPSEMVTKTESDDTQKSHVNAAGYREQKGIPAGRPGNEADMAQAVLTCAANQYMNGETIRVDGGYLLKKP